MLCLVRTKRKSREDCGDAASAIEQSIACLRSSQQSPEHVFGHLGHLNKGERKVNLCVVYFVTKEDGGEIFTKREREEGVFVSAPQI